MKHEQPELFRSFVTNPTRRHAMLANCVSLRTMLRTAEPYVIRKGLKTLLRAQQFGLVQLRAQGK